jgi:predicted secreted protein
MLQTWTMARPRIEGIRERGGAATEVGAGSPLSLLADDGFRATLATNSVLEFDRYLRIGEELVAESALHEVSERKGTTIGVGYFVTWITSYRTPMGEEVGRQHFRIFRFDPSRSPDAAPRTPKPAATAEVAPAREKVPGDDLPTFDLDVTATVVVAGAIASRDFMPVHHDRDYAQAQGAPDLFMNILTTNGYVSRVRRIAIRLGAPSTPGRVLRFTGGVTDQRTDGAARHVEITLRATNDLGDHATGTVDLTLPA